MVKPFRKAGYRVRCGSRLSHGLVLLLTLVLLSGCSGPGSVEEIRAEGVLHVVTRNASSLYYEGREGPTGYDYELARRFADYLGVQLKIQVVEDNSQILSVIEEDYAHIALAGLSVASLPDPSMDAVANGLSTQSVVIYNRDEDAPADLQELKDRDIHTLTDSNHIRYLEQLQRSGTPLQWTTHPQLDAVGILERVESGEFDVAVIDANELALNQVFFPRVKQAFDLGEPEPVTWFITPNQDGSLAQAARDFMQQIQDEGTVAQLQERFYGHLDRLGYVGAKTFVHHLRHRLPKYASLFQEMGKKYQIDWRLLAAIGYQESHWRRNARSPTGVRGLMMLTRSTASYVGISNRLDPEQSIRGGARYFAMVHDRIDEDVPEPDRTWFALAAYNVGYGHLEDARILTRKGGDDPNRWMDVKEYLPLLAQKEWYTKTRYGYARGHEPVIYVQNIRRYYDVLAWMKAPPENPGQLAQSDVQEIPQFNGDPMEQNRKKPELPEFIDLGSPSL